MKLVAWMLSICCCSSAFAAQPAPIINPVGAGAERLGPDASLDQILQALQTRGQGLKGFTANVVHEKTNALSGNIETLKGKVWLQYIAAGDARIRVLFDSRMLGERRTRDFKREYLLDKGVLVERDYGPKLQVKRRILKPDQKMDPLKLGEGPFPLPIGQDPNEVKRMFDATKIEPQKDDPPGTVHVELTPKPGSQFARRFKTMDVWVDQVSHFPTRIRTIDPPQNNILVTDLKDIQVNPDLADREFNLEKIDGWTEREEQE